MSQPSRKKQTRIISASAVGQWIYCNRAWWLARRGATNQNTAALQAGSQAHEKHGQQVASAQQNRSLALYLLALGVLLLLVFFLASQL